MSNGKESQTENLTGEKLGPSRWKAMAKRSVMVAFVHLVAFAAAYLSAYMLRFEFSIPADYLVVLVKTLPLVLAVKLGIFYVFGNWRFSWRHPTFSDLIALLKAATLSALVLAALKSMASFQLPRSIVCLDWAMTILFVGGIRSLKRFSREEMRTLKRRRGARKALIIGTNPTAESLARYLASNDALEYSVAGYLDDDRARHGSWLVGGRVLGSPEDVVRIASECGAHDVLAISDVLSGPRLRRLVDECRTAGLTLKAIPAMDELLSGEYRPQIRDVDINDLLRREPVQLNNEAIGELLAGRTVMVTGAGGSIGSEICRQVLKFRPERLLLVERAENSLFYIHRELLDLRGNTQIVPCLADITDRARVEQVFGEYHPEFLFHAAAHKHVPMMEFNPGEAIKNNVAGTAQLAELADDYGVQEFVLISTDKSVNPTSVMGASKQLAERFVHAYSEVGTTKFVVVRFGNVLASAGSVVPIFQEQIRQGGPVTITHPDMKRYFMTIPEASQLVLQATAMGKGGEIFVLDMGEPVRILDLAHDLIRLSGRSTDQIEISITGTRPGEKLFEELYFDDERMLPTPHSKLFVAFHRAYELDEVRRTIAELTQCIDQPPRTLKAKLREFVPEYTPDLDGLEHEDASGRPSQQLAEVGGMPNPRGDQSSTSDNSGAAL